MRSIDKEGKARPHSSHSQLPAKTKQYVTLSDSDDTLSEGEPEIVKKKRPTNKKKAGRAGRSAKVATVTKPKRPMVEEDIETYDEEDEEDEEDKGETQEIVQRRPYVGQCLHDLESVSKEFLQWVKTDEDVKALVDVYGVEKITEIEEKIGTVAKLLRSRRAPKVTVAPMAGTLQSFDQYFVLRDVRQTIMLIAPVEIFRASQPIQNKTLGFVRKANDYWPLMCALSGGTNIVPSHEKILDSEFWTHEVFRLGTFGDFEFRSSPYEQHQKLPRGMHVSGHVEPKLMVWYACRVLCKVLGPKAPTTIRKQVSSLGKINGQKMRSRPVAEIVLDREPCPGCKNFQAFIEDYTGIKFNFIVCAKLGKIKPEKDGHGNAIFPLLAEESDPPNAPESERRESELQVVIPQRAKQPNKPSKPSKPSSTSRIRDDAEISTSQIVATKQTRQITPIYDYGEEDNNDVYLPTPRKSRFETPTTLCRRGTRSTPLNSQHSFDFGYENLPHSRKERKKRKFDAASYMASPLSAKKHRNT